MSEDQRETELDAQGKGINRRAFVRTGTSFLVVGSACGEGTTPTATGTIRLLLTGLHASATSGGTATATPTGGGPTIQIAIPASGDQSAQAPVGTYTVSYAPPPNHSLGAGVTVPSQITITEGATTTVSLGLVSTGNIAVNVTGLVGSPANGGSATAQLAGSPDVAISVSAGGTGSATGVPTGTYTVTYTPPSGYSVSGPNPATGVVVGLGATANVGFTVSQIPSVGSVRVTVTGLTGAPNGGSATGRLTDNTGATFNVNLSAPSGGTATGDLTGMPAGSYNITYTAPTGFRLVNPASSPAVVAVTAGNQSSANFVAEVAPAPAAIIFHSDWSTALGTTAAARRDTNKASAWTTNSTEGLEVVASTGLDFPTTNVLRVNVMQASVGFSFLRKTGMPVPNVGESRYYRWYSRVTLPDNVAPSDPETHPHQDGSAQSQANWLFHIYHDAAAGQWRPQFRPAPTANAFPNDRWSGPLLNKNQTYRFELHIARTGTTTFQMHVRVYDSVNPLTPIHTDSAFTNQANPGVPLSTNPTFTWLNVANMDGLNAGLNGLSGTEWFPLQTYMYQGAVAVGSADWIGPYANGI